MPIEKPAHIHETRMRHISDADLFAALDLTPPALAKVRAAVAKADWPAAYAAWAAYFAKRATPVSVVNLEGYATLPAEQRAAAGQHYLDEARALATAEIDHLGVRATQSAAYGQHYFWWLNPLVPAYALDRDEAHAATYARHIREWYAIRDQVAGTIPDLDVIWYTLGLGIRSRNFTDGYVTFRHSPALTVDVHAALLKSLLGAQRWLAEEHTGFRYGNWQIHGVATLYEMGVFFPEFREAGAAWRAQGWTRLIEHLDLDIYADGGHSERSPSYHAHVLDVYARVASVAELNGQPLLQAHPRFAGMYHWLAEQLNANGASPNFNDSHVIWVGHWAVPGAVLLDDPALKGLAEHFGKPHEIAWTLAGLPPRAGGVSAAESYARLASTPPAAGSLLQPVSKFAIMRAGLAPDDLFMAITYGPLIGHEYESHSHLEALAFVASGYGTQLALEAGLATPGYDSWLYKNWLRTAQAHNMVIVDGQDPDENAKDGDLLAWSSSPLADLFAASHAGYQALGVYHRRLIFFVKGEYWLIYDELYQTGAHQLAWQLYTPHPLEADAAGRYVPAVWPGLVVVPIPPGVGRIDRNQSQAVVTGPRAYEGRLEFLDVPGLSHIQQTDEARVVFRHLLYPARDAAQAAPVQAAPLPLDEGEGEVTRVTTNQGADLFLIQTGAAAAVAGWRTDARTAWLRAPDRWAIYTAAELKHGADVLYSSNAPLTAAHLWPVAEGAHGLLDTTHRAVVTLRLPWPVAHAYLDGVRLPEAHTADPAVVSLLLPGPGQHSVRLVQAG